MTTYEYPPNSELQLIDRELAAVLTMDDPIFAIMPIVDVNAFDLLWDIPNNITGLTNLRGLNGQPGNVSRLGANRFKVRPGVYGEFLTIDEEEMTTRAQLGTYNIPVNVDDLVRECQDQLINRRISLIRKVAWLLIATGTFSVINSNTGITHTDTYDLQDYNASTWSTVSTATPLADFRATKLLQRGKGVSFGRQAKAFMNQTTFNYLTANTNASDLAGKRQDGLRQPLGLSDINSVLLDEDLPQIVIQDDGYLNDAGTFVSFIADNKVTVVGYRPGGQKIADFAMVRNANNPNVAPGPYLFVNDKTQGDAKTVPPTIEVHGGFNGGPRLYYPSAIVDVDVS
jgi:hypothetical protein